MPFLEFAITSLECVEAHLTDENGPKSGQNDKRCLIEARLEDRPPISVSEHSDTLEKVVSEAASKLARMIESTLGRVAARSEKSMDGRGNDAAIHQDPHKGQLRCKQV